MHRWFRPLIFQAVRGTVPSRGRVVWYAQPCLIVQKPVWWETLLPTNRCLNGTNLVTRELITQRGQGKNKTNQPNDSSEQKGRATYSRSSELAPAAAGNGGILGAKGQSPCTITRKSSFSSPPHPNVPIDTVQGLQTDPKQSRDALQRKVPLRQDTQLPKDSSSQQAKPQAPMETICLY